PSTISAVLVAERCCWRRTCSQGWRWRRAEYRSHSGAVPATSRPWLCPAAEGCCWRGAWSNGAASTNSTVAAGGCCWGTKNCCDVVIRSRLVVFGPLVVLVFGPLSVLVFGPLTMLVFGPLVVLCAWYTSFRAHHEVDMAEVGLVTLEPQAERGNRSTYRE